MALVTAFSQSLAVIIFAIAMIIHNVIKHIKVKGIKTLDNENQNFWEE